MEEEEEGEQIPKELIHPTSHSKSCEIDSNKVKIDLFDEREDPLLGLTSFEV